jgi:hypothetical protein
MPLLAHFRRRTADGPPARAGTWQPDGHGVTDAGGDIGEGQVSSVSWAVRLRNVSIPGAVIDLVFYVVTYAGEGDDDCYVQLRAEWITCTDPDHAASTATWTEAMAWDLQRGIPVPAAYEQAAEEAAALADDLDTGRWTAEAVLAAFAPGDDPAFSIDGDPAAAEIIETVLGWDGQPFEWEQEG